MSFIITVSILLPIFILAFIWLWILLARQIKDESNFKEVQNIVTKAQQQSAKLITEATKKSEKILHDTEFFAEKTQSDLDRSLQKTVQTITQNNEDHINKMMHHYDKIATEVNEDAKKMAEEKITSFANQIHNQIKTTTEEMDRVVAEELKKIRDDLSKFEETKKRELEDTLTTKVSTLVKEITNKAISQEDHERLVKEALSKAEGEVWS